MKHALKTLLVGAVAAGGLTIATTASAEIVCNGANECWHTHAHYNYHPGWGIVVHPNNWAWGSTDHYTWHEHSGRGYWNNGAWTRF